MNTANNARCDSALHSLNSIEESLFACLNAMDSLGALKVINRMVVEGRGGSIPGLVAPFMGSNRMKGNLCAALSELYLPLNQRTSRTLFRAALDSPSLDVPVVLATLEVSVLLGVHSIVRDFISLAKLDSVRNVFEQDAARLFRIFDSMSGGDRLVRRLAIRFTKDLTVPVLRLNSAYLGFCNRLGREEDKQLLCLLSRLRIHEVPNCLDARIVLARA